ncbi:MAG: AEC family transporter [Comamonadaceae bacterium]|nr:AEC family transporter [Comamonadaceae bacterium]
MDSPALTALLPVVLIIVCGAAAAKIGWIRPASVRDLSQLVFYVLTPALLFRTMASVRIAELDFKPVLVYFLAAGIVFAGTLAVYGFNTLAATRALGHTFSNNVMIGIPLIGLVFGKDGLVVLFTLISVHALVLLGSGTVILEIAQARQRSGAGRPQGLVRTLAQATRNSIVHPVPLPIIAGLLFAQTGWTLPLVIDKPLQLLGSALGPMALLLVGVTLAYSHIGSLIKPALRIASVKIVLLPLVFLAVAWVLGLGGVAMASMALAASLPTGANVLMFAQRYGVAEEEITASIALGTMCCLFTVPLMLMLIHALQRS